MNPDRAVCLSMTFAISTLSAVVLVPVLAWLARRWGLLDHPHARKQHLAATPLVGGVAIVAATASSFPMASPLASKSALLVVGCLLTALVGVLDDRFEINARFRLAVHLVLALMLAIGGFRTYHLPLALDVTLSTLWIAGMVTAVNCLDCADGVVGGFAAIQLLFYGMALSGAGRAELAGLSMALAGACVGFLAYNLPRARVFLGDAGSGMLGFLLGAISLRCVATSASTMEALVPVLPLTLPVVDCVLVHIRRYRYGIRRLRDLAASTGKDHLPHRLLGLGMTPRQALLWVYGVSSVTGGSMAAWPAHPVVAVVLLGTALAIGAITEYNYVRRVRSGQLASAPIYVSKTLFSPCVRNGRT